MDAVSAVLINFGFGGAMVAAFIWLMHFSMTKVLPDALNTIREEMAQKRKEFLLALKEQREDSQKIMQIQQDHFSESLEKMEASWQRSAEAICQSIDSLTQRVERLDNESSHPTNTNKVSLT